MGRAVFGLLLGFTLVFGVALWARTCLPDPNDEEIEWLEREDVIVVQAKSLGGDNPQGTPDEVTPPWVTIYGDGTILVTRGGECQDKPTLCETLFERQLSGDEVRDLLSFVDGTGFFDFAYQQPQPPVSGAPTTLLFATTNEAQNLVRANALGWHATGGEWNDFRKLQEIYERLTALREKAVKEGTEFRPEKVVMVVRDLTATSTTAQAAPWPFGAIDLASIAVSANGAEFATDHGTVRELMRAFPDAWPSPAFLGTFTQNKHRYDVLLGPVLPYEENFPEFEPPTQ